MLFSILVPIYNAELYLRECLDSILSQNFYSYELLLLDDGSTDDSGKICDEYQEKYPDIISAFHQENKGLFETRRKLFDKAKGEYCICVDSDDFLSIGALNLLSEIIDRESPDFILYELYTYNASTGKSGKLFCEVENPLVPNYKYENVDLLKDALLNQTFSNWSMCAKCIKTEFVQSQYEYERNYGISYGEDALQSVVLYNGAKNFVYCNQQIYNYRIASGMTKKLPLKFLTDFHEVALELLTLCKTWTADIETISRNYFSRYYFDFVGNVCRTSDNYNEAKNRIREADNFIVSKTDFKINYNVCRNRLKRMLLKLKFYELFYVIYNSKRYVRSLISR